MDALLRYASGENKLIQIDSFMMHVKIAEPPMLVNFEPPRKFPDVDYKIKIRTFEFAGELWGNLFVYKEAE